VQFREKKNYISKENKPLCLSQLTKGTNRLTKVISSGEGIVFSQRRRESRVRGREMERERRKRE